MSSPTPQQQAAMAEAIELAKKRIGWTGPSASIPYAQREAYVTALAEIILANPERFTPDTLAKARRELGDTPDTPLQSYGIGERLSDFGGEVANQAGKVGEAVASVGEGVKSTLHLSRYLIPLAAVAALVILLQNFSRRTR